MNYRDMVAAFDDETQLIIEISLKFIVDYFDHERPKAERLIVELLRNFPDMYDEDFIHAESSYGLAAGAHYLCALGGERGQLRDWMIATGHSRTPADALDYFRKTYFQS